jgi:predicted dehydrogenase
MMFGLGSHSVDQALELFGVPKTITGFYRSLRGIESEIDDAFTIILQYGGEQKNLLVTVKTSVVSTMQEPLKLFVRGYNGSFVKFGEDKQESQVEAGMAATDEGFGIETEDTYGLLTTKEKVDESQKFDEKKGKWIGKYPSLKGDYVGFYEDLVKAIKGEGPLVVKPEQSRDGIRVIEIARDSANKGSTLPFN